MESPVRPDAPRSSAQRALTIVRTPKRVRGMLGGEIVVDSRQALLVLEQGHHPIYYFPLDAVRGDCLRPSRHRSHCPLKGEACYWHLRTGARGRENALWAYPDPVDGAEALAGRVAFYWNALDAWFEEEEQVYVHPRSPFCRIDALSTGRHVRVESGGELVADTTRGVLLLETGQPMRFYLPRLDVLAPLERGEAGFRCAYKGEGIYYSVCLKDRRLEKAAWSFLNPTAEAYALRGMVAFDPAQLPELSVDGEPLRADRLPRPGEAANGAPQQG